jgi:hypothetical protein
MMEPFVKIADIQGDNSLDVVIIFNPWYKQ